MSESPGVPATGSEPSSDLPETSTGPHIWKTGVAVAVVAVLVAAIALIAGVLLAGADRDSDWIPVYQDVLKTSFGALVVGGLGGLVKLIFDRRKEREDAEAELRNRQYDFISTLVKVSHDIDTARLVIRANRSVKSWTDMVNDRIIPARCRLRDMTHELNTFAQANLRLFADTKSVVDELEAMNSYLRALLEEYGANKQRLGEVQLKAEEAKTPTQDTPEQPTREQLLTQIWTEMQALAVLGDLLHRGPNPSPSSHYTAYRRNYEGALLEMRRSLVPREAAQSTETPVSPAQDVTTPLSSDPR